MINNKFYNEKDMEAIKILEGFLPDRIFDAHAHLYDKSFTLANTSYPDDGTFTGYRDAMMPVLCNPKEFHMNMITFPDRLMQEPSNGTRDASDRFIAEQLEKDSGSVGEIIVVPTDTPEEIEKRLIHPRIRGLKCYYCYADIENPYNNAGIGDYLPEAAWEVANKHKLAITVHMVKPKVLSDEVNLSYIIDHAKRYPDATLILAHAARSFASWTAIESIHKIAHFDNVWYDFSAICESPAMFYIMKKAGVEKCMWGSDFPVCTHRGKAISFGDDFTWIIERDKTKGQNFDNFIPLDKYWYFAIENLMAIRQACIIGELSEAQIEDLFFNNAKRLWNIQSKK